MRRWGRLLAVAALLSLAGCVTGGRGEFVPEFVGRSVRVEAPSGNTLLQFRENGTVVARFGERETRGRWTFENYNLCFLWAGDFRECWPHDRPFRRGETVTVRSDRGNSVRVTLL